MIDITGKNLSYNLKPYGNLPEALNLWTVEVSGSVTVILGDFCCGISFADSGPVPTGTGELVPPADPVDEVTGFWEDEIDGEVGGSGDLEIGGEEVVDELMAATVLVLVVDVSDWLMVVIGVMLLLSEPAEPAGAFVGDDGDDDGVDVDADEDDDGLVDDLLDEDVSLTAADDEDEDDNALFADDAFVVESLVVDDGLPPDELCDDLEGVVCCGGVGLTGGGEDDRCLVRLPDLVGDDADEEGLFSGTISGDLDDDAARGGGILSTRALYRLLGGPPGMQRKLLALSDL